MPKNFTLCNKQKEKNSELEREEERKRERESLRERGRECVWEIERHEGECIAHMSTAKIPGCCRCRCCCKRTKSSVGRSWRRRRRRWLWGRQTTAATAAAVAARWRQQQLLVKRKWPSMSDWIFLLIFKCNSEEGLCTCLTLTQIDQTTF